MSQLIYKKIFLSHLKRLTLILLTLFSLNSFSLNKKHTAKLDSLKLELNNQLDDTTRINTLISISQIYSHHNIDSAIKNINQGLDLAKKIKNKDKELIIHYKLASLHSKKGNHIGAYHSIERSLDLAEQNSDSIFVIKCLAQKGRLFLDVGLRDKAVEFNQMAINKSRHYGFKHEEAHNLYISGWYLFNMRKYEDALENFKLSSKIFKELKDTNRFHDLNGWLANTYNGLDQYDKAIKYRFKHINYKKKINRPFGVGEGYRYLADIYAKRDNKENNDLDSAINYYKLAQTYYIKSKQLNRYQLMLVLLANTYYRNNEYNKAKLAIDELFDKKNNFNDFYSLYVGNQVGSKVYKKTGDLKKAIKCFENYIEVNDSINKSQEAQIVLQNSIAADLQKEHQKLIFEQEKRDAKAQAEVKQQKLISYSMAIGISGLLIFLFFVVRMLIRKKKDHDYIQTQHLELEAKNKEIIDSINYAKRIQNAILPTNEQINQHLKNSFVLYQPKDIVAGDFYWMTKKENKIFFAVADCTGHGVPGAMVSVICNNGLNRAVREYGLTEPGKILDKTREIVIEEFEKSEDDVKDGMDIALCSIENNKLKYAGAHNPLWVIRNNELITIKANKQPIGKFDKPEPYTTHTLELEKGDSVYLFSDGYIDQFGGEKGKKLKTSGFKELLLSIQSKLMKEQYEIIQNYFNSWKGDIEQLDDVCIIGIKI